mmetsp:Transcript_53036/g.105445  ORF Transcript_53036/g.105445 Transcript_53036/m.105445 type:complete len:126 (-) Transcript_53036:290-667(-)|eukprot:CAMPEP_0174695172 /NCGR_PEP_ID=MMETSP1094-20130205/1616_1 /TAXON_ID=156173 /ORGANISM="Chrysochromulina brevifilum, Strain UTEX LB 985" /LENGTH=125 /DNA_ID=CAMNT_0015891607 /DNA_START=55 /DNA_END=432 /DNA_ORIENTATION=-
MVTSRLVVINSKSEAKFDHRPGVWTVNIVVPDFPNSFRSRSQSHSRMLQSTVGPSNGQTSPPSAPESPPRTSTSSSDLDKSTSPNPLRLPLGSPNPIRSPLSEEGNLFSMHSPRRAKVQPGMICV